MPIIMNRMDIPAPIYVIISDVVRIDEGGWKLNPPDSSDNDGGWTYGGITSTLYNSCFTQPGQKAIDRQTVELVTSNPEGKAHLSEDCYQIYFQEFCVPLAKIMETYKIPEITAMELSCFINLGADHFYQICKATGQEKDASYKNRFLGEWRRFYCDLVARNAEVWKNYAESFDAVSRPDYLTKPKFFRAKYLVGWIERVDRYV